MMTASPVILLLYANDEGRRCGFLRALDEEAEAIRAALCESESANLCEVVERRAATADDVFNAFQDSRYRDRIAVLHYAGHADSYHLMLQSARGNKKLRGKGLAEFIGLQRSLALVFLNGCSTHGHVAGLLRERVSSVIATSSAINDQAAAQFAARFYRGLSAGSSIRRAYHEARTAIESSTGSVFRDLSLVSDVPPPVLDLGDPWQLRVRHGAESALDWNLPSAAGNPLFGLPALPECALPEYPYKHLDAFTAADAELFFGRGHEIRTIYEQITSKDSSPLLLISGQSGVGKSSLLRAGLLPRLAEEFDVRSASISRGGGILECVQLLLGQSDDESLALESWAQAAKEAGRPVLIAIDHVEEVFLDRDSAQHALDDLLEYVERTLLGAEFAARGRLVLSFRKEWLSDVQNALKSRRITFGTHHVDRLDRDGIVEAVTGPAVNSRLQEHFGLVVDEALPDLIATNLLADSTSPVAPTLQIILRRLWAATADDSPVRFTLEAYRELVRDGHGLADYVDAQLSRIEESYSLQDAGGLALDVLAYHARSTGFSEERSNDNLKETYGDRYEQAALFSDLFCRAHLLVEVSDPPFSRTRLAHDTLAPIILDRFTHSERPGQRAFRILQNRQTALPADAEHIPLDDYELGLVESGMDGMRAWTSTDRAVIAASRAARDNRQQSRRVLRVASAAAIVSIVALSVTALVAKVQADRNSRTAQIEAQKAERVTNMVLDMFRDADPGRARGERITVRQVLDQSRSRITDDLSAEPEILARMLNTMGQVYTGLGLYDDAMELAREAEILLQRSESSDEQRVSSLLILAKAAYLHGEYPKAQRYFEAANSLVADSETSLAYKSDSLAGLGDVRLQDGDFELARDYFLEALALDLSLEAHDRVARDRTGLGKAYLQAGLVNDAQKELSSAIDLYRSSLGPDHPLVAEGLNNLGAAHYYAGDYGSALDLFTEAVPIYETVYGSEHPEYATLLNNIGRIALESSELHVAEKNLRLAISIQRQRKGENHDDLAFSLSNLGIVLLYLAQPEAAAVELDLALEIAENNALPILVPVLVHRAETAIEMDELDRAKELLERAQRELSSLQSPVPWHEGLLASARGELLAREGHPDEALDALDIGAKKIRQRFGGSGLFTRIADQRLRRLRDY